MEPTTRLPGTQELGHAITWAAGLPGPRGTGRCRRPARPLVAGAALALLIGGQLIAGAALASAHNAGHVIRPNGTCVDVGSTNPGPFVPENNPHYHDEADRDHGRLDLIDGPGDQYGARFAASRTDNILPGECP